MMLVWIQESTNISETLSLVELEDNIIFTTHSA